MPCTDAHELLRKHSRRLAATVAPPGPVAPPVAVTACIDGRGGITEELLVALTAHNQALDRLQAVVDPLRGWPQPPAEVSDALDSAYRASDAAHQAVREALASVRDAARLQRDAVRVAHLAVMIAVEVAATQ